MRDIGVLLERDAELVAAAAALGAVEGGSGRVLWIEGPAGIGKSQLLEAVRDRAAGLRVLEAAGSELERGFSFGVVRALFEPAVATRDRARRAVLLSGAARLAAPVVAPGEPDAGGDTADRLHGLYWLTANLADEGPLLLMVDDAHWADEPSLLAMAYLARRVADLPVGLVVAARPEAALTAPGSAILSEPLSMVLRPAPLSRAGSDAVVRNRIGEPDPAFGAACHDAAGGNPLLLVALLDALAADGTAPDPTGVAAVRERAPAIVATSVLPRLRRLTPDAGAVARAVALLGPDAHLRHVAALAGMDHDAAATAIDALVGAGLLGPGRPTAFVHPLLAEAVAEHMTSAERHRGHRLAAARLAVEHADPERVAGHLLAVERLGDPEVVALLRGAAQAAVDKGAPPAAVTYLARALEEPPAPDLRWALLAELGAAQLHVTPSAGLAALETALAAAPHPRDAARIALTASHAGRASSDFRSANRFVAAVEGRLGELDDELRYAVEAEAVFLGWMDPTQRSASAARARELASCADERATAGANVVLTLAFDALLEAGTRTAEAVALAERAARLNAQQAAPAPGILGAVVQTLAALDQLDLALRIADDAMAAARARGLRLQVGEAATFRALVHHRAGRLTDAEYDARLAHTMAGDLRGGRPMRWTLALLLRCLVDRGEIDEAAGLAERTPVTFRLSTLREARGHLRAAQGRPTEALSDFIAAGERASRQIEHPGVVEWRPAAALALHDLGRSAEALAVADEAVDVARRYAARRALGLALRARGLVAQRIDDLAAAVEALDGTPSRLEHARAQVDLGAALRRVNRRAQARPHLEAGRATAHACGAPALAERARVELAATGARPRRIVPTGFDALTASERRVVQLAGEGLTNREIAQALFVTTKTVETHLGAAYRKLGVAGRAELPGAPRPG